LFAIGFNSCKKDFITAPLEETGKFKIVINGISLESVNFKTFKKEVDFNKLGKLKTTFESASDQKSQIKLEGTQNDDFAILLDSVKKLVRNGKTSYVFALKQNTPRAISFRNLTIEQNATKDSLKVFITVYTPDKKWIDEFKKSGRANWSGKVSFRPINLAAIEIPKLESTNNKQVESDKKVDLQQVCSTITVAVPVYSRCPDEEQTIPIAVKTCLTGINIITHTECWMIEPPGGGGYGGGQGGGYNPCDGEPGPIGIESVNGMQLFVVPPTPCDPTAPGDPYPIPPSNPLTAKEFLIQLLSITDQYVINKIGQTINPNTTVTIADKLANYYYNNGGYSSENIDFLNWAANYLTISNAAFEDFENEYLMPNSTWVEIDKTALKQQFPCASKYILDKLETIPKYKQLVLPFIVQGQKPTIKWNASSQTWGTNGMYQGGYTQTSPSNLSPLSSEIFLNTSMLQNASILLNTAVAVHETYHAYINYLIIMNAYNKQYDSNWLTTLMDYSFSNSSSDFSNHYVMMTNYINDIAKILFTYGNGAYTIDECRKAALFGLNNPGANATQQQTQLIQQTYSQLLIQFNFSSTDINNFNLAQINASSSNRLQHKIANNMRNYFIIYFFTFFSIQFAFAQNKISEKKNIKLLVDTNSLWNSNFKLEIYNDGPAIIYSFTNEKIGSIQQRFFYLPKKEILIDSTLKVKNIKIKRLLKKVQRENENFNYKYNLYLIDILPNGTPIQNKVFLVPYNKNLPIVDFIKLND
jgi:hypothetical protein